MSGTASKAEAFASIADRLAKLLPRLASDHEGEVVATVAALRRTLAGAGLDLHDLARRAAFPTYLDLAPPKAKPEASQPPPPREPPQTYTPPKPKRQPPPWPTWGSLSHFGRLAMFDEIKAHGRIAATEAEDFALWHKLYYQHQCGATRARILLFNKGCRELWERGARPEGKAA